MDSCRAIENLIYTYAEYIDTGNLEGVAELFRNGEIVAPAHNSRQAGYDEVLALYTHSCRIYESTGTPLTKHLTTNVIIELDEKGNGASARSYFTVIQATPALALQPIISGRYHDSFRRVEGSWEFSRREMTVDLLGNCAEHLLYDASGLA